MQHDLYREHYSSYFAREDLPELIDKCKKMIDRANNIYFLGNGGSNSVCSHMMEDFGKMLRKKTFAFSDASLITCYANDYGYENAFAEWLKLYQPGAEDLVIVISSSGKSPNILNAVNVAKDLKAPIITLSGFSEDNPLCQLGEVNLHINSNSYGIVETIHQVFLHTVLDQCYEQD